MFVVYNLVPSYYTLIELNSCYILKPLDLKICVHMALRSTKRNRIPDMWTHTTTTTTRVRTANSLYLEYIE